MTREDEDNVYGRSYVSAQAELRLLTQDIIQHEGKGFDTLEQCVEFANKIHVNRVIYLPSKHAYIYTSAKGKPLKMLEWMKEYRDVLFYKHTNYKGIVEKKQWEPYGFETCDNAYLLSETNDGSSRALYYRDYFRPKGWYNSSMDRYNYPPTEYFVPAKETGADTSHIYEYLKHISGECYEYLLAWLRTKMIYPDRKTEVVPIFISQAGGNGKSTFAEVILKGMFGPDNVTVTSKFDASARFNSDVVDKLIVCHEEKQETDRKNLASALKDAATNPMTRKENKGVDPIYQASHTDYVFTTNEFIPIKIEDGGAERRFMIMESDPDFRKETSSLARDIFTRLYGSEEPGGQKIGVPFVEDKDLISQFKHELFQNEKIASLNLREFPKTAASERCKSIPQTNESVEIMETLDSLIPFIEASLKQKKKVTVVEDDDLSHYGFDTNALLYLRSDGKKSDSLILNERMIFSSEGRRCAHSTVMKSILSYQGKFKEHGFEYYNADSLVHGFPNVMGYNKHSRAIWFRLLVDPALEIKSFIEKKLDTIDFEKKLDPIDLEHRNVMHVNNHWRQDNDGEYETVNTVFNVKGERKLENCSDMSYFLLESDETTEYIEKIEYERRAQVDTFEELFRERLRKQRDWSEKMFNEGVVSRVVYSGKKSHHNLIRVLDPPQTVEEYKWMHAWLCNRWSEQHFDSQCNDPLRLTRSPIEKTRSELYLDKLYQGTQKCLLCNWKHEFNNYGWRHEYELWVNRPLLDIEEVNEKKIYPTDLKYTVAAQAMANETFWSDAKFHGERQKLFFAAYRILRSIGFSHNVLWSEGGILAGIDKYYKPQDIGYWKSRESCSLIQRIDADYE